MSTPDLSKSARLYQERMEPEHRNTRRFPAARHDLGINAAHGLPMHPPYPTVDILHDEDNKPPEAGETGVWPRGAIEI